MEPLVQKPNMALKCKILEVMFGISAHVTEATHGTASFFDHYEVELLKVLKLRNRITATHRFTLAATTHQDILNTVKILRTGFRKEKRILRNDIVQATQCSDNVAIDALLGLTIRLWLMINVREPAEALYAPQTPLVVWPEESTLEHVIASALPSGSKWTLEARDSRIHPAFTASFMTKVCGLRLEWTTCLADHLRLDRRAKALRIFPYKMVLRYHLAMPQECASVGSENNMINSPCFSLLPSRLLEETIWTLNLLFPHWEPATSKLLSRHRQTFECHGPYDLPPTMNFIEFDHWRDRLLELHDLIFMSPPVSWEQLWRDRRNPQQFWTFWIALVILLLTLVSTVSGLVQAWASVKSLNAK